MSCIAATNSDIPDPTWDAFANTLAGSSASFGGTLDITYDVLEDQYEALRSLCTPEQGEVMPTDEALHRAWELVEETSTVMLCHREGTGDAYWDFPLGFMATDDNGGIRIEWWRGKSHCIALDTGYSENSPMTVFVKFGANDPGRLVPHVYPSWLAAQLVKLNKVGQQG